MQKPGLLEALVRLLHSYTDESRKHFFLFYLLLKLDDSLYDNPGLLFEGMREYFNCGCASPFLYIEACRLLGREPSLLREVDSFAVHALRLGAKRGLVGRELALRTADLAVNARGYHRLCVRLLEELYEKYPEEEILSAVCSMLIRAARSPPGRFSGTRGGLRRD